MYVLEVGDISSNALEEIQKDCDYCYDNDSYAYYETLPVKIQDFIAEHSGLSDSQLDNLLVLISW